jgi:hypothetical protein
MSDESAFQSPSISNTTSEHHVTAPRIVRILGGIGFWLAGIVVVVLFIAIIVVNDFFSSPEAFSGRDWRGHPFILSTAIFLHHSGFLPIAAILLGLVATCGFYRARSGRSYHRILATYVLVYLSIATAVTLAAYLLVREENLSMINDRYPTDLVWKTVIAQTLFGVSVPFAIALLFIYRRGPKCRR